MNKAISFFHFLLRKVSKAGINTTESEKKQHFSDDLPFQLRPAQWQCAFTWEYYDLNIRQVIPLYGPYIAAANRGNQNNREHQNSTDNEHKI